MQRGGVGLEPFDCAAVGAEQGGQLGAPGLRHRRIGEEEIDDGLGHLGAGENLLQPKLGAQGVRIGRVGANRVDPPLPQRRRLGVVSHINQLDVGGGHPPGPQRRGEQQDIGGAGFDRHAEALERGQIRDALAGQNDIEPRGNIQDRDRLHGPPAGRGREQLHHRPAKDIDLAHFKQPAGFPDAGQVEDFDLQAFGGDEAQLVGEPERIVANPAVERDAQRRGRGRGRRAADQPGPEGTEREEGHRRPA